MLTFEGGPIQGTQNIMQKLQVNPTFELPACVFGTSQVIDAHSIGMIVELIG